ncbi:MAG: dihydrofolate reductase family protein [Myxococcota bacterium]
MSTPSRVRVYMGCSLDGFIAGPDHDLAWLHDDYSRPDDLKLDPAALQYEAFMEQIGAMLMGRATYDAVAQMGPWKDNGKPVLVATHRPFTPPSDLVRSVSGTIETLIHEAKEAAGEEDVYIDGGDLVCQALNAGLVDEITLTYLPILLSEGTRLFDGLTSRSRLQFVAHHPFGGGLLQVTARVHNDPPSTPSN